MVQPDYQLTAGQVPRFYVKFRSDDLDAFMHGFLRDPIRNAFRISTSYGAEENAIEAKIAATQLAERAENVKRQAIAEPAKAVEIARGQAQASNCQASNARRAAVW